MKPVVQSACYHALFLHFSHTTAVVNLCQGQSHYAHCVTASQSCSTHSRDFVNQLRRWDWSCIAVQLLCCFSHALLYLTATVSSFSCCLSVKELKNCWYTRTADAVGLHQSTFMCKTTAELCLSMCVYKDFRRNRASSKYIHVHNHSRAVPQYVRMHVTILEGQSFVGSLCTAPCTSATVIIKCIYKNNKASQLMVS